MWLDWLVFCDYGFSVFALWCPLATPTVLLGFLPPWTWGISSRLLQQSTAAAPYLGRGVSPHCRPSWPSVWDSSSRPSCACAAMAPWTPSPKNTREDYIHEHHQMVNTKIRLIIFFAAKDGEALYSQQKQDQELTVAQTMNSLLPNSDLNLRKWEKTLNHSGIT